MYSNMLALVVSESDETARRVVRRHNRFKEILPALTPGLGRMLSIGLALAVLVLLPSGETSPPPLIQGLITYFVGRLMYAAAIIMFKGWDSSNQVLLRKLETLERAAVVTPDFFDRWHAALGHFGRIDSSVATRQLIEACANAEHRRTIVELCRSYRRPRHEFEQTVLRQLATRQLSAIVRERIASKLYKAPTW